MSRQLAARAINNKYSIFLFRRRSDTGIYYIVTLLTAMYLDGFIKGDILTMASLWGLKFQQSQEFPLNWSNCQICNTLHKLGACDL